MTDDPIGDELNRLKEDCKKLLGKPIDTEQLEETNPNQLAKFGLTFDEAQAWLDNEPSFSSDASYHEPRNRRKVNRTEKSYSLNIKTLHE